MLRPGCFLLLLIGGGVYAQTITPARQVALNSYVEYANKSVQEAEGYFHKVASYYPEIKRAQAGRNIRPFTCGDQLDDYYFNQAISKSAALSNAATLNAKATALRSAAAKLDEYCKALDTYCKLKDYERDQYKQALELINSMQTALTNYRKVQQTLAEEIESTYRKLQAAMTGNAYQTVDAMMKQEISRERAFLDLWNYNLNDEIHTGWPVDRLPASILETDKAATQFAQSKLALKYPASSMIGSFAEAVATILESKRSALDADNFEAKKSDIHGNETYLNLINYFNGTLVADQNMFIQYATSDEFRGIKAIQYVPLFDIRSEEQSINTDVKAFQDIPHATLKISPQPTSIPKPVFQALSNYIDFINESVRQVSYLHNVLRNYNSSARYYKDLTTYKGKGGLSYNHNDFQIPQSIYQSLVTQSNILPVAYRKSLNDQAEVLMNILKEMDQLSIALTLDASERRYEKDNLKRAYEILDRNAELFKILDDKKEQLYLDTRAVFESYATVNPTGSWALSNKALLKLTDEDRTQLFKAKAFLYGDVSSVPVSDKIDTYLRDVIANELTNMKGIERYGRYNGLCPYTPYEDLPQNSRTFSEKIANIKTAHATSYGGPYRDFVYMYNVIADNYNKFCELAKVDLLKTVKQPELYEVRQPEKPEQREQEAQRQTPGEKASGIALDPEAKQPKVIHDTVTVTRIKERETKQLDTIYIEKHDTIYLSQPGENVMSMEGYATNNLVFLLDVSGSMNAGQKLPLLKKSMVVLLNMLRPEDQVSVVVYSGKAKVALPPTSAQERDKIKRVIENLRSDGGTDGNAGIRLAYKVADGNYIRAGNNRIVLATDGEFPISEETLKLVGRSSTDDILLTVFNFGNSSASSQNLEKLASQGKGHYELITRENSDSKLIREAKGKKKK